MILDKRLDFAPAHQQKDRKFQKNVDNLDITCRVNPVCLHIDRKPTHRVLMIDNSNPRDVDEIGSKIIAVIPRKDWCRICAYQGITTKYDEKICIRDEQELVPKKLVIFSEPFFHDKEKMTYFDNMIEKINLNVGAILETIAKKREGGGEKE